MQDFLGEHKPRGGPFCIYREKKNTKTQFKCERQIDGGRVRTTQREVGRKMDSEGDRAVRDVTPAIIFLLSS